jgi:7-cyano-7-deazaguanine synthase
VKQHDSVAIFSGGLDSTTLVYEMLQQGLTPHLLSFDYGQRHSKELLFAEATAHKLGLRWDIVDLTGLTSLISNSALTSPKRDESKIVHLSGDDGGDGMGWIEVPEGHYAEDNMKLTVVPNRNMIMLSIAAGVMVNNSYKLLATGVHSGDHFVYPDCRPNFLTALNAAIVFGNEGFGAVPKLEESPQMAGLIYAPFLMKSKADIAYEALNLSVPLEDTWSCYKGYQVHCGRCGTCVERLEAIYEAELRFNDVETSAGLTWHDKTVYEDNTYWKTVTK